MKLHVYLLQDQRFVLVPDCSLPSIACRRLHGPTRFRGTLEVADTRGDPEWRQVLGDIGVRTYAVLDQDSAWKLFGVSCALFDLMRSDDGPDPFEDPDEFAARIL
jgi:hypothetical protein